MYEVDSEVSLLRLRSVTRGKPNVGAPVFRVNSQVDQVVQGSGSGVHETIDEKVIVAVAVELELGNRGALVPEADLEDPGTLQCRVTFDV